MRLQRIGKVRLLSRQHRLLIEALIELDDLLIARGRVLQLLICACLRERAISSRQRVAAWRVPRSLRSLHRSFICLRDVIINARRFCIDRRRTVCFHNLKDRLRALCDCCNFSRVIKRLRCRNIAQCWRSECWTRCTHRVVFCDNFIKEVSLTNFGYKKPAFDSSVPCICIVSIVCPLLKHAAICCFTRKIKDLRWRRAFRYSQSFGVLRINLRLHALADCRVVFRRHRRTLNFADLAFNNRFIALIARDVSVSVCFSNFAITVNVRRNVSIGKTTITVPICRCAIDKIITG